MNHAIATGDVLATLRELPDNSFDGLLTDPPYGFKFMGKRWDYDVPSVGVWRECYRVLKPGAALLSFGGARTFHRIACGLEDAGFELRDCLTWLYAKGFPKSLNVGLAIDKASGVDRPVIGTRTLTGNAAISLKEKGGTYGVQVGSIPPKEVNVTGPATELAKQWDGWGTALKPAWEPILLARKPLEGTVASNVECFGTGALNIDACRIEGGGGTTKAGGGDPTVNAFGNGLNGGKAVPRKINRFVDGAKPFGGGAGHAYESVEVEAGRWPANLLLDEGAAAILDAEVGNRPSRPSITANGGGNQGGALFTKREGHAKPNSGRKEEGGPSRFFFCAKVSTKERELGCESLPKKSAGEMTEREDGQVGLENPRAGAGRTGGARNHHPTLKPIALVKWLASLIMPSTRANPNATLLVPYSGAGSEMIGACLAGWPLVFGIEGEADYVSIANARLNAWVK